MEKGEVQCSSGTDPCVREYPLSYLAMCLDQRLEFHSLYV